MDDWRSRSVSAAKAALAERATAVAACLVTTAFVGGAVALLRKR